MRPLRVTAGLFVTVAVVALAWVIIERQQRAEAAHVAAVARLRAYQTADKNVASLVASLNATEQDYTKNINSSSATGQKRHDELLADPSLMQRAKKYLMSEENDIKAAQSAIADITATRDAIAKEFETLYGAGSVQRLRDLNDKVGAAQTIALSKWYQGLDDQLTNEREGENGEAEQFSTATVEQFMVQASDGLTGARPAIAQVFREIDALRDRLRKDVHAAEVAAE